MKTYGTWWRPVSKAHLCKTSSEKQKTTHSESEPVSSPANTQWGGYFLLESEEFWRRQKNRTSEQHGDDRQHSILIFEVFVTQAMSACARATHWLEARAPLQTQVVWVLSANLQPSGVAAAQWDWEQQVAAGVYEWIPFWVDCELSFQESLNRYLSKHVL